MEFIATTIPDVILIKPKVFGDERGFFIETYRRRLFEEAGIAVDFVQDNMSKSRRGTVRGLHYQLVHPQAKLVMVTAGSVRDVAVDLRQGSPTFGQHVAQELSRDNHHMLYVPAGFAHGFEVLSEEAVFQYKCSDYYFPEGECGVAWNDPDLNIAWNTREHAVVSGKDQRWPNLTDISSDELF